MSHIKNQINEFSLFSKTMSKFMSDYAKIKSDKHFLSRKGLDTTLYRIVIEREDDVYMASTIGKRVAEDYGLSKSQQTKLVVSIMELTRNIVFYAKKGELFIKPIPSYGIEIIAIDQGPAS